MKKVTLSLILAMSINYAEMLPFKSNKYKDNALIILLDVSGLNISCTSLFEKNMLKLKNVLSKNSLNKMRNKRIEILISSDKIKLISKISNEQAHTNYYLKELQKIDNSILEEMRSMNTNAGRDIYSSINFVKELINSSYTDYDNVGVLIISNLRQSVNVNQLKELDNLKFEDNVYMDIYAKSGLMECDNALNIQNTMAEQNMKKFWSNKIIAKNLNIETQY